jgi:hypothetical protein
MDKPQKNARVQAILLDPVKQQVHTIEFQGISALYQVLDCDAIQGYKSYWAGKHNDEVMYFDEEALIKNTDETRYAVGHSMLPLESVTPIIGRVVICRVMPNGTHADTTLERHEILRLVRWYAIPPQNNRNKPNNNNLIIN